MAKLAHLTAMLVLALALPGPARAADPAADGAPPGAASTGSADEAADETPEAPRTRMRAAFLGEGTYATEEHCKSLRTYEATGSYAGETIPRLITAEGAKVGGEPCFFSAIEPQGVSFKTQMSCSGGCETFTETFTFTPHPAGGFEITAPESDKKLRLVRCEPARGKETPTN